MKQEVAIGETIIYTYDVAWKESDTHWASRWDIYLTMNHAVKNRVRFESCHDTFVQRRPSSPSFHR